MKDADNEAPTGAFVLYRNFNVSFLVLYNLPQNYKTDLGYVFFNFKRSNGLLRS
jgi:hypothetical protein